MKFSRILKFANNEFGINLNLIKKFEDGFRNSVFLVEDEISKNKLVLIVYKKEKNIEFLIKNAHSVASFLQNAGFPVRCALQTKKGKDIAVFEKRFICLYNYLEGISIPWEAYERKHLKAMGSTLSNMHYALKDFPASNLYSLETLIKQEIQNMREYFKKVEPWIKKKLGVVLNWKRVNFLTDFIGNYKHDKNALHMDFVRGNVIFSDDRLSDHSVEVKGILDFEKVAKGSFVGDIARTLSFLIVDCKFKEQKEVIKWFMDRGYVKRGGNHVNIHKKELYFFMYYFWFKDFWKFLLHNPYEYLKENEHYVRTRDKLIQNNFLIFKK